jgi:probable F420-dependent oxidoreductase
LKFGYILPNYGDKITPAQLVEISKVCEEAGFDSVWATDHVIMPVELREPYGELLEPLVTLSFIASACPRLKVGTSCIVLPQRNPILLAKQAAALDVFSGGRVILGFGAGWAEQEFGFMNADFRKRGKVMDESIRLMKTLWRDDVIDFEGEFFKVKEALFLPKPANGEIPVWIGGNGDRAVDRTVRLGDGWHPVGIELAEFRERAAKLREARKEATISLRMTTDVRKKRGELVGVNGEKRVTVSGSADEIRKEIDGYAEAGLQYYCASMNHPSAADIVSDVRKFSAEVVRSYS